MAFNIVRFWKRTNIACIKNLYIKTFTLKTLYTAQTLWQFTLTWSSSVLIITRSNVDKKCSITTQRPSTSTRVRPVLFIQSELQNRLWLFWDRLTPEYHIGIGVMNKTGNPIELNGMIRIERCQFCSGKRFNVQSNL